MSCSPHKNWIQSPNLSWCSFTTFVFLSFFCRYCALPWFFFFCICFFTVFFYIIALCSHLASACFLVGFFNYVGKQFSSARFVNLLVLCYFILLCQIFNFLGGFKFLMCGVQLHQHHFIMFSHYAPLLCMQEIFSLCSLTFEGTILLYLSHFGLI